MVDRPVSVLSLCSGAAGLDRGLFGRICAPSTAARGVVQWISSLVDTPASRFRSQVSAEAQMTLDTCGLTSPAFFVNSANLTPSLKTCRGTCPSDCAKCDASWKAWVTALRLSSSERRKSARRIDGNGSSSWPTPMADRSGSNQGGGAGRVGKMRPSLDTLAKHWATPTARDWKDGACAEANVLTNGLLGREAARWATPTVKGNGNILGSSETSGDGLETQAKRFGRPDLTTGPPGRTGMVLNPRFVETMMGWPVGWCRASTSCVSVAVESSLLKLPTLSNCSENG